MRRREGRPRGSRALRASPPQRLGWLSVVLRGLERGGSGPRLPTPRLPSRGRFRSGHAERGRALRATRLRRRAGMPHPSKDRHRWHHPEGRLSCAVIDNVTASAAHCSCEARDLVTPYHPPYSLKRHAHCAWVLPSGEAKGLRLARR